MGSPGKNTGAVSHFLLQGISPPQELNLVSCIAGSLYHLRHQGNSVKNQFSSVQSLSRVRIVKSKVKWIKIGNISVILRGLSPVCEVVGNSFWALILPGMLLRTFNLATLIILPHPPLPCWSMPQACGWLDRVHTRISHSVISDSCPWL